MIGLAAGMAAAWLAALACPRCPETPGPAAPDAELEVAHAALKEAYLQAGLCPPCADAVLSKAAQSIVAESDGHLPGPVVLQRKVQAAGGGDPSPRAMLLTGRDAQAVARDLDQQWRPHAGDQVLGLALVVRPPGVRLVVLSAERKVAVDPLPSRLPVGGGIAIEGVLLSALRSPSIYVEGPNGLVARLMPALSGARFNAHFEPAVAGEYQIEVLAQGSRGPEVLFLKSVAVGVPVASVEEAPPAPGTHDDPAAVLEAINRERQKYGAPALATDARLDRVAQSYARELRELGIFAHLSPRSGDLKDRLRHAGYAFRSAAENLAQGPTGLEAQSLAANSPAHRQAMLDPTYTRCGIGLSRAISGEGASDVLLVEVFALEGR